MKTNVLQKYLKELGYYKGKIDNIKGPLTQEAILNIQKRYFKDKSEHDGICGRKTEILIINAIRVKQNCKNFTLEEFRCDCGGKHCTGYPAELNTDLLRNIQKVRDQYGSCTITSGLRCKKQNEIDGGIYNSRHLLGSAVDFWVAKCGTKSGRENVKRFLKSLNGYNYTYSDTPQMGNCIHFDVKL